MKNIFSLFALIVFLTACGAPSPAATQSPPSQPSPTTQPPAAFATETTAPPANTEVPPTSTALPPTETPAAAPQPRFPAEPQRVEFQSEDGTALVGYYYPAAVDPAPTLVLMHWARGTQCDWVAVNLVQWAQNRGLPAGVAANPACANAVLHIPSPLEEFPPLPAGQSYAVFTFDFRGYGESAGSPGWNPAGYLQDSNAAMKTAQGLDGVDAARVAAIGSSIGADGAIDACAQGCPGALSLSPGSYLGKSYAGEVTRLGTEQKYAWCAASPGDGESYPVCNGASGDFFQKFIYEKNAHGTAFFAQGFDPKVTQVIMDFLQLVFVN